jgi:hypothetical protein
VPKNLVQRISTTSDTNQALQTILNAGLHVQSSDLRSIVNAFRQKSDQSRAIESRPIVVSFGSDSGRETRNWTEFGWVIAPQLQTDGTRGQVHGQYSLAAVVSLPSWWRSVRLEVERCWIPESELQLNDVSLRCPDGKIMLDVVRLPGDVRGIPERLRFDARQEPHLDESAVLSLKQIEVGQPAELVLTGGRLWRSTEVTLGSQRADKIVVLPNMEGIVASFKCITPQTFLQGTELPSDAVPGGSTENVARSPAKEKGRKKTGEVSGIQKTQEVDKVSMVPVRVWTSEGVTPALETKVIMPAKLREIMAHPVTRSGESRLPVICLDNSPILKSLPGEGGVPKAKREPDKTKQDKDETKQAKDKAKQDSEDD